MKKEELIALGVSEEIAKQIMSINGTDIEAAKTKAGQATEKASQELENLKLELKTTKETLEQANVQIKNFEGLDVEGIKKQAEEWKTKYETFENQSKADKEAFEKQLQDQQYDFAVKEFVSQHKFTNDFVKDAFINDFKSKGLKLEEGKFLGADDHIKNFIEKNPGVFVVETAEESQQEEKLPEFTHQTNTQTIDSNTFNFGWNPPTK